MPVDNMEKKQLGGSQRGNAIPKEKLQASPTSKTSRRSARKRTLSETAIDIKNDSDVIEAATSDPPTTREDNAVPSPTVSAHKRKKYGRHSNAGKTEILPLKEKHKTPVDATLPDSPSPTHNKPEEISGSGRVYGQDKEDKIVVYVWEHRDMELPLSSQQVTEYARQVVGGNFKASKSWLRRFLARNELTLPLIPPAND